MKKFCTPTHLDKEDFGYWWIMDQGPIYVQTSPDKEHPLWVLLGDLFMAHVRDYMEIPPYEELAVVLKSMSLVPLEVENE